MKKFLLFGICAILGLTSCLSGGNGGGSVTPEGYEGHYTTYVIDGFNGKVIDQQYDGKTKIRVDFPDIIAGELDFTFLGVKFVALMPELEIKVPSLPYDAERNADGTYTYKVDVAEAVPMIGDAERNDYMMRNIKASISKHIEFQFELQKREKIYRVVFTNNL